MREQVAGLFICGKFWELSAEGGGGAKEKISMALLR
jgi:hypothetical protein